MVHFEEDGSELKGVELAGKVTKSAFVLLVNIFIADQGGEVARAALKADDATYR